MTITLDRIPLLLLGTACVAHARVASGASLEFQRPES